MKIVNLLWLLVPLSDRQVEVYTQPRAGGYSSRENYGPGSHVPVVVDGETVGRIAVDALLP
jgi:hypothetical protein